MNISSAGRESLKQLLSSLFSPREFVSWTEERYPALANTIPMNAAGNEYFSAFVSGLMRRNLANKDFFGELALAVPEKVGAFLPAMIELGLREPANPFLPNEAIEVLYRTSVGAGLHEPLPMAEVRTRRSLMRHVATASSSDLAAMLKQAFVAANRLSDPLGQPEHLTFLLNWAIREVQGSTGGGGSHASALDIFQRERDGLALRNVGLKDMAPTIGAALERMVDKSTKFVSVDDYIAKVTELKRQVCAILRGGKFVGTGFLVGPDLVLTNHHVANESSKPTIRFDHAGTNDTSSGCDLADDWLVDSSPHSPLDIKPVNARDGQEPPTSELDYSLLRLAEPVGDERGFMKLSPEDYPFQENSGLIILQHPHGDTLQFAASPSAVIGVFGERTRVRYRVNTLAGSSGSPVFDVNWNLVALHHSGSVDEPGTSPDNEEGSFHHKTLYNEGIPISTIISHLSGQARTALSLS